MLWHARGTELKSVPSPFSQKSSLLFLMPEEGGPMYRPYLKFSVQHFAMAFAIVLLAAVSAAAQMAPTRTWEELKEETQRRVDKNLGPVGGLKSEDARE